MTVAVVASERESIRDEGPIFKKSRPLPVSWAYVLGIDKSRVRIARVEINNMNRSEGKLIDEYAVIPSHEPKSPFLQNVRRFRVRPGMTMFLYFIDSIINSA
jgi:hypothetical protein